MTAQDFTKLHLQYGSERQPGELPAAIEHDFADGRMVDHYYLTPSPAFWADEDVAKLCEGDEPSGLLFSQQPNGAPWQIIIHQKSMLKELTIDFPDSEFRAMLAASGIILPGEPGFVPPVV